MTMPLCSLFYNIAFDSLSSLSELVSLYTPFLRDNLLYRFPFLRHYTLLYLTRAKI